MRILHISTATDWGDDEEQAFYLARGLVQKGHAVMVAAPERTPLATKCTAEGCTPIGSPIHSHFDFIAFWKLTDLIQRLGARIVHAHDPCAHTAAVFAKLLGAQCKLVVSCRANYEPRPRFLKRLKQGHRVDCFIAVSRIIGQQLTLEGIELRRVVTVRSGIDVARFVEKTDTAAWKREQGLPLDTLLIGLVDSLASRNEPELFVRAAYRLSKVRPDLHFVIVGDGETRPLLEQLVSKLDIQRSVSFTGKQEDTVSAYQSLTIAVLPATGGDGSLTGIKAAMAAGVPTLSSDEPSVREIVDHGVNGFLVPPKSDEAMAEMILLMLNDKELCRKVSENAQSQARDFRISRLVDGTEEVYSRLLGTRTEASASTTEKM